MKQLTDVFSIGIASYAIMSNHYHVIVRIDRDQAQQWSDDEVADRWLSLFAGNVIVNRWRSGERLSKAEELVVKKVISTWRQRLYDLGWFMRCLNEHIARLANQEDGCKGRFGPLMRIPAPAALGHPVHREGRYKSQALLDEKALLTCMSYVDLNPIRANIAKTPEASDFTSIQERIQVFSQASRSKKATRRKLPHLVEFGGNESLRKPENTIPFHLDDYITLVDWTGRAIRTDKRGSIPKNLAPIFERINMSSDDWLAAVKNASHAYGLAKGPIARLKEYAERIGRQWIRGQSYCKVFYRFAPD